MNLRIVPLEIPERLDDSAISNRFREYIDVRNTVFRGVWGGADYFAVSYEEGLGSLLGNTEERQHILVALEDDRLVGIGRVDVSVYELTAPAYSDVNVHPSYRHRGIGSAIADRLDAVLRQEGRSSTQTWQLHRLADGPQLTPPTGAGSIPANDDAVRFLQHSGFALEQIERTSELAIEEGSEAKFLDARADAIPHAEGYTLRSWAGYTPADQLETIAALYARMSTDAPSGGMDVEAERWDADRLEKYEKSMIEGRRGQLLYTAAFDDDGTAVAFTTFDIQSGDRPVFQGNTLVHAEHRGHRLGMLVKAENLLQLLSGYPDRDRVITWNAEENRHMLSVNEALGFRPIMNEGAWQRREVWAK